MACFPFMVEVEGKPGLVIGGGRVALHKVKVLLPFGVKLRVVSEQFCEGLYELFEKHQEQITLIHRSFVETDLLCVDGQMRFDVLKADSEAACFGDLKADSETACFDAMKVDGEEKQLAAVGADVELKQSDTVKSDEVIEGFDEVKSDDEPKNSDDVDGEPVCFVVAATDDEELQSRV